MPGGRLGTELPDPGAGAAYRVRHGTLPLGWVAMLAQPAFAARLQDAVDLGAVRDDLAGVGQAALEPAHLALWTAPHE